MTRSASRGTSGSIRKPQGGWHAEHNRTVNGLWLRMSQITVDAMVHFQIGEQRFQIKVP